MKSILYILEDGRFGGMNKMTADIAERVTTDAFQVHLLLGDFGSAFFVQYLTSKQITYTLVRQSVLSKKKSALLRYAFTLLPDLITLFRVIRKLDPDIVYCNGSQQIKGVLAATLAGKKVIWHMHDTYQPRPLLILFKIIKVLCRVQWFVASCQRTIDFYGLDTRFTHISRPPIDTTSFRSNVQTSIDTTKPIKVLTISNVNTDKGIDTLIKIAAELNNRSYQFDFTVVGLGADSTNNTYKEVDKLMTTLGVGNVDFVGQKADIQSILSEADLYLCTSRNESGPISVFEALAMQVPVVSTDVGDLGFLFAKYKYGPVFPVGDYMALANELYSQVEQPEKYRTQSLIGRKIAEQELDIAICVAGQIPFYAKVLSA